MVERTLVELADEIESYEVQTRRRKLSQSMGQGKGGGGGGGGRGRLRAGAVFAPFSTPAPLPPVSLSEAEEAQLVALVAMGFERALALRAFIECGRNQEHAANYLLSGAI